MCAQASVELAGVSRVYRRPGHHATALDDVSLRIAPGETLAIVGESGAGKSTLSRLIAGLDRPTSGEVLIGGGPPQVRGGTVSPVQMVFQNPLDALNPFWSVGSSIGEPLRKMRRRARKQRVEELMAAVGLNPSRMRERPQRFSGGQLQRVVLARALAGEPDVLLCDEPTSALDVSVQAQIVNLLLRLKEERGFTCILVTHDLNVVRVLAERVAVLLGGKLVECSTADRFFTSPEADYSQRLLAAMSE